MIDNRQPVNYLQNVVDTEGNSEQPLNRAGLVPSVLSITEQLSGEPFKKLVRFITFIYLFIYFFFRPKSRKQVKTGLKSPKELLERQINDFKGRVDTLNTELARVLKTESDLNSNVGEMEQDNTVSEERLEIMRNQLVNTEQRKNNLLMKVDYVEEEIAKKTRELKALK